MANKGFFSAQKDNERIAAGGSFFCNACLVGKPAVEQSLDKRYCQGCYDILLNEASLLPVGSKKQGWQPVPNSIEATPATQEVVTKPCNSDKTPVGIQEEVLLHKKTGGRPRKQAGEPISRMTRWRREKQGVLSL